MRVPYGIYQGSYRETFVEIYKVSRNDFKGFYKKPRYILDAKRVAEKPSTKHSPSIGEIFNPVSVAAPAKGQFGHFHPNRVDTPGGGGSIYIYIHTYTYM